MRVIPRCDSRKIVEGLELRAFARTGLLAVGVLMLGSGCSSLVTVNSDPKGASIRINGRYYGITPATFEIGSSTFGSYQLTLEKDGYQTAVVQMEKETYIGRTVVEVIFPFLWPALFFNIRGPKDLPYEHFYKLVPE